ncbi:hypothetical protein F2Q68_00043192 [Brassica cretica]|uniref:Neprosin PEP catalytic domain-containing protein n=1 Tax=Brassica cretica TaxID=69181 RepID=A0A8S9LK74_BRACR|nr:hypothetical protein F2Q68_00043192 [Brassica cretica]
MINQIIVTFMLGILIIPAIVINGEFSDTHDAKIDLLLKKLNKPAVKSIKSPYGGIIDCVHMKNHPIYDHPLFKNYTIQYATLRVNGIFRGAEAVINVWKPYVQMPREFSLAQMWLVAGPPSNLNTIEFGWQVYPGRYGDDNARFFIYWTADGYRSGCYNLDCPGFVPVNQAYVLGEPIGHVSTLGGSPDRELVVET